MTERKKRNRFDYKKFNADKRFCNKDVIYDVSQELNIAEELVQQVADSQSEYTARTMRAGGLETIIYVYIGKFKVNPLQIQKMMANGMKL